MFDAVLEKAEVHTRDAPRSAGLSRNPCSWR